MTLTCQWPYAPPAPDASTAHVWLRILSTTDIHGHILPCDTDRPGVELDYGLARVASLIHTARHEARNTLLCDNGDFLQGNTLGDLAAQPGSGWTGPNPVIDAMNALRYDVAALGNHEFNFGLKALRSALGQARFPVVCANAVTARHATDPAQDTTLIPASALVELQAVDSQGMTQEVRVGFLGLLPPQITQ